MNRQADVFVKIIKIFILGSTVVPWYLGTVVWDLFTVRSPAKIIEIVGQTLCVRNELDKPN